jgi:hypothetical protein
LKKRIFECHAASYLDLTDGRGGREEVLFGDDCCRIDGERYIVYILSMSVVATLLSAAAPAAPPLAAAAAAAATARPFHVRGAGLGGPFVRRRLR